MCTDSFDKEMLSITIRNLYPGSELTSPVYCGNSTICHVSPSQQTNIGTATEASFEIAFKQKDFKGALLHKLQRKYTTKTDNQPNSNTASDKDIATSIHLLVVWDVGYYHHHFYACLIELTDDFTWNEDKLWALYSQYMCQSNEYCKPNIITWLVNDGAVLKTRLSITYGADYKLAIVMSEGTRKYEMSEPIRINPKWSVSPL
jgi:hypothetical protein